MLIGITGGFGSGKTTVASIFSSLGARIINADHIAHRLIRPKSILYRRIIKSFGKDILGKGKIIDRSKLAGIVFKNKKRLKDLNAIVHPAVIAEIKKEIIRAENRISVLDAPLLIEAGLRQKVDVLIVVRSSRKKQMERLLKKRYTRSDILNRIASQIPLKEKIRLADFVIDNNGSLENTRAKVTKVYQALVKNECSIKKGKD